VETTKSSLEDVFLSLTGKGINEWTIVSLREAMRRSNPFCHGGLPRLSG